MELFHPEPNVKYYINIIHNKLSTKLKLSTIDIIDEKSG